MRGILMAIFSCITWGYSARGQVVLEQYIQEGFQKNQGIQEQEFVLEKSVQALQEAKSLFRPKVALLADYFLAGGGRTVDFPAGDLLNPVYSSLNQLTSSTRFPQLENQSILLNPNNFYDVRFRTTQPLINLEIEYNKRIKNEQVALQKVEIDLYKRELAKEIKVAYFSYLQSVHAITIYKTGLQLVEESRRINESLFRNEKVNRSVVLRAESEITKWEALHQAAQQNSNVAQAYFNFLLNRNLEMPIVADTGFQELAAPSSDTTLLLQREELKKLNIAGRVNQHLEGLARSYIIPKVNVFLDLGSQGFDGRFDKNTRYYFGGISLQWDLFSSGRNNLRHKQVQIDYKIIQSQYDKVVQQLRLQWTNARHNYQTSWFNYKAAVSALGISRKYYADMLRIYKEGQALYIELLDAQNQWIQAELQLNISLYDTYIKAAEIERASASFNIEI